MARSNGPADQAGTQAPQWRYPTDQDAQTRPPAQQPPAWPFQAAAGQPAAEPPRAHQQPQPQAGQHPSQHTGQHAAMFGAPPAQPFPAARAHAQQPGHHQHQQPAFAPLPPLERFPAPPAQQGYVQPQQAAPVPPQNSYFGPEPTHAQRPTQRNDGYQPAPQAFAPQHPQPQHHAPVPDPRLQPAPSPALRGPTYDQWAQAPDPRTADPHHYDLGNYMAAQPHGQQQGHGAPPPQSLEQWSAGHEAQAQQQTYDHGHGHAHGHGQGQMPGQGQLQHADNAYQQEFDDDEADEPKSGRRGLMVAAALVGAIALGGALAFGYKSFLAPQQKTAGAPPSVKNPAAPAKTKPADPGGKQFANQDSKVLGRLNEDGDTSGVKKVPVLQVGRDGTITAPPPAPSQAATAVPGLFLDTGPRGPAPTSAPPPAAAAAPAAPVMPTAVAAAAPRQPVVAAPVAEAPAAPVAPKRQVALAPTAAAPEAVPVAPKAPAKKPKPRDDLAAAGQQPATTGSTAPASAPAALGAPKASNGFVAVLASRPSQMDALKTIADLQQKYPAQLANKIVTVQETDLSAQGKGVVHRVVVGPPGSRDLANDLCGQIKTAGHKDCWLTAY